MPMERLERDMRYTKNDINGEKILAQFGFEPETFSTKS